jgi:hypothetical protein
MMSAMHLWECKDNNLKVTLEDEILEIKRSKQLTTRRVTMASPEFESQRELIWGIA